MKLGINQIGAPNKNFSFSANRIRISAHHKFNLFSTVRLIKFAMTTENNIHYDFNDFTINTAEQELLLKGKTVSLSRKAFQILLILIQNAGQVVEKEQIFSELWADSFVGDANLTQHIYVLRKLLGQSPDKESYIETIPKRGYRFNGAVKIVKTNEIVDEPDHNSLQPEAVENETILPETGEVEIMAVNIEKSARLRPKINFFSHWKLVAVSLIVIGITTACFSTIYLHSQAPKSETAMKAGIKAIAVLPFKVIDEQKSDDKLGLRLADTLITKLGRLLEISVRPTSAVFHYAAQQPPPSPLDAGRELDVDAVLEGTVQRDGERIRISIQLVNAVSCQHLWAQSFEEKNADIFAVQDVVTAKIVADVSAQLSQPLKQTAIAEQLSNADQKRIDLLENYLWKNPGRENLVEAVQYFENAVRENPQDVEKLAKLADVYSLLGHYGFADSDEMRLKARNSAEKALSLNADQPEAHAALALIESLETGGFEQAQKRLERIAELVPYCPTVKRRYLWVLFASKKFDEAARQIELLHQDDSLAIIDKISFCEVLSHQPNLAKSANFCIENQEARY